MLPNWMLSHARADIHCICETKYCQGKEQRPGINWNEQYWLNWFESVNGRTLPQLLKYFLTMVSETAFGMPPTYILGPAPWGTADLGPFSDAILPLLSVPAADPASMGNCCSTRTWDMVS